jgi:hypothetical protein
MRAVFIVRDDASMKIRLAAALLVLLAAPAEASVLYKSVDPNGTVTFSDTPPPADSRLLGSRPMDSPSHSPLEQSLPQSATAMEAAFQMIDYDKALREANERVDLAEHALALARSEHSRTHRPGLNGAGMPLADAERIEFHKRDLRSARAALMDLLRSRQLASGRPVR